AEVGRGIFNLGEFGYNTTSSFTATAAITNTIIGQADTVAQDFTGQGLGGGSNTTSGLGNLIRTQGGFAGSIVSTADPLLAVLARNGAPTQTMAPLPGSPAIAAGSTAVIPAPPFLGPPFTDQRGPGFARIANGTVDIGAYELTPFFDNFTGTGSLSSNWQRPPLPEKYLFLYRRPGPGFTENNKAISTGTGINTEQVVGLSPLDPTLQADVTVGGATAVGLMARIQGNGNAYVAVLTSTNQVEIGFFNAASNLITPLETGLVASGAVAGSSPTLQLVVSGTSMLLLVNGVVKVGILGDSSITLAGGVGIFAQGANGGVDNFL